VLLDASHFVVRHADGTEVDLEVTYDSSSSSATLVSTEPLRFGRHVLTVDDGIVGAAAGLALDGEIHELAGFLRLPSGDGVAGGEFVGEFLAIENRRVSRRTAPR
jgi:hypothetical protein